MKITALMILLLLLAGFVSGFAGFYGAMLTEYGANTTSFTSLQHTQDIFNKTEPLYTTMQNATQNKTISTDIWGALTAPANLVIAAFQGIMTLFSLPTLFGNIFNDLGVALAPIGGIPTWTWNMI